MSLPQSVAEQTRWEPSKIPGWSGRLMMFSATVFLVSVMSYIGLRYPYQQSLLKRESEAKATVQEQSRKISTSQQEEIVAFYSQINNVEKLLASHVLSSRVFTLLEEKTLPSVFYSKFSFSVPANEVKLTGVTRTFEDINKQVRAFAKDERVAGAVISNVANDVSKSWNFDITLTLAPGVVTESPWGATTSGGSGQSPSASGTSNVSSSTP